MVWELLTSEALCDPIPRATLAQFISGSRALRFNKTASFLLDADRCNIMINREESLVAIVPDADGLRKLTGTGRGSVSKSVGCSRLLRGFPGFKGRECRWDDEIKGLIFDAPELSEESQP